MNRPSAGAAPQHRLDERVAFCLLTLAACSAILAPPASARPNLYLNSFFLNHVSAYSAAPDGSLAPVAGSPFATEIAPYLMAMTPDSQYLYVGNFESADVSAYSAAPDGSLVPVAGSPFPTGTWPWGLAVSPDGAHLFVVNNGSDSISSFSIAPDGRLAPVSGSPFATVSGARSNGVAVTPDGKHLYVPSGEKHSIVAFSIAPDGSLAPVAASPFEAGATPREVSVTPDGKYLYVSNVSSGTISAYSIAADGSLSAVPGAPFDTEGAPQTLAVTRDGKHLYVTHVGANEGVVWGYSIAADGSLSQIPGAPFVTGGYRSGAVAVSPNGRHLYVTSKHVGGPEIVSAFAIATNGSLTPLPGFPLATEEGDSIAITPDQGPAAAFSATPTPAGDFSSFDASASNDPDGGVASYEWDFGDGHTQTTSTATAAHTYADPGEYTVTLTATDNESCSTGQTFTGQTVSCNGSPQAEVSHQLTVPPGTPLSIALTGSGSGSVTSSPEGIVCPESCSYAYEPDTLVTLIAKPAAGSTFTGWSGAGCSGAASTCEVSLSEAKHVAAAFTLDSYVLKVATAGNGVGDVNSVPTGISECGLRDGVCQATYDYGTAVTLTATPAPGSTFSGWSGEDCAGTGSCQVTISADSDITATFSTIWFPAPTSTLTVKLAGAGHGTVRDDTAAMFCPPGCVQSYADGTGVTLSATPAPGSTFARWSGAGCSSTGPCRLTINADTVLAAKFTMVRPPPPHAHLLVSYRQEGGIGGQSPSLKVLRDHRARAKLGGCTATFALGRRIWNRLQGALRRAHLHAIAGNYPPPQGAADEITYVVKAGDDMVRIAPPQPQHEDVMRHLRPLLKVLNMLVSTGKRRMPSSCKSSHGGVHRIHSPT